MPMTINEARKAIMTLAKQDHANGQSVNWARDVDPRKAVDTWRSEAATAGDLATCEAIDLLDNDGGPNGDAADEYQRAVSALCHNAANS